MHDNKITSANFTTIRIEKKVYEFAHRIIFYVNFRVRDVTELFIALQKAIKAGVAARPDSLNLKISALGKKWRGTSKN